MDFLTLQVFFWVLMVAVADESMESGECWGKPDGKQVLVDPFVCVAKPTVLGFFDL